jgi:serum/glucocorticoid-regulated kinase 2
MIVGLPPFYSDNQSIMYDLIQKAQLRCPTFVSEKCKDLLENLLKRNPDDRLGSGTEDEMAIRKHAFFANIDFDKLYKKEIVPEFQPKFNGLLDASNFDR